MATTYDTYFVIIDSEKNKNVKLTGSGAKEVGIGCTVGTLVKEGQHWWWNVSLYV